MWVVITLVATVFQIVRTSEQHRLRRLLDVNEAGYVRFVFAMPFAVAIAAGVMLLGEPDRAAAADASFAITGFGPTFPAWVALAGISQIVATVALLQSFRVRDFAVGTVYAKTEVVLVALASWLLLGEPLPVLAWAGAVLCLAGVGWLAAGGRWREVLGRGPDGNGLDPAVGFGVLAGGGFALASIGIRAAANSLDGGAFGRSIVTVAAMLLMQSIVQGVVLVRSRSSSLRRVLDAWRVAVPVALLSLGGSAAWAWAMTLENAARVRTLGQIEIVLAFAIGIVVHRERHRLADFVASAVAVVGIIAIVIA